MNRYTALIEVQEDAFSAPQLKQQIEAALLRQRPHRTFKLGSITYQDGLALAEFLSDAPKDALSNTLRGLEATQSLRLKSIAWGWLVSGSTPTDESDVLGSYKADPYVQVASQSAAAHTYSLSKRLLLRLLLSWGAALLYLISIVFYVHGIYTGQRFDETFRYISSVLAQLALLMMILSGPPLFRWNYASQITCDLQGIEFKYLLKRETRRLAWEQIYSLEWTIGGFSLGSSQGQLNFYAGYQAGLQGEAQLVKTIITRAGLNFVSANIGTVAVYKQPDAP